MDNSDLSLPTGALPGQLADSLWPDGSREDSRGLVPLYITRYAGPRALAAPMGHPFWELTYVMGGEGYVEVAGREIFLGPEAGLLLPPGCLHRERTDHPQWDTLWVGFQGSLPDELGLAEPLALDAGYALRPWAEQIWLWRQRETGTIGPELAALGEFLLRACVRLARQENGTARKPWLASVQDYIDHHLASPLAVQQLAAVAGCSVGHFHRLFQQATGETPVQYLTRRRLEVALLYLRESGLPIQEIATAVGFPDPLYFSRVFRRQFGQSPSRTRWGQQQQAPTGKNPSALGSQRGES